MAEAGEARYAMLSGEQQHSAVAVAYRRYASLFSPDAIDALSKLHEEGGEKANQARALLPFASEGFVELQVADQTDEIATAEARAAIMWRGDRIPYRAAPAWIAEMSARSERNALDSSYREAVEAINPLREARFSRQVAAARELGHADLPAMARETRGIDIGAVAGEMQRFMVGSETQYFAALRRFLAEIDIEQGDASVADLWHVLRGAGWDARFLERGLRSVVGSTLSGMGIDLDAQDNVSLDLERRADPSGGAWCVPVQAPGDVRVVLRPRGGHADYEALLSRIGQAETYAHLSPDAPAAYRFAGDDSVGKGYAWVFEQLTLDADWLRAELEMSDDELVAWLDFAAFRVLHEVRRTIAGLFYELRLHGGGQTALHRAYYAGTLGLLTGVRHPESSYLADVDDHFVSARRFRGWCVGSSLAAWLRDHHGVSWWRNAAAGAELRQGWSRGQKWNAEALVAHFGYDRLDWRPILRQIRTHLIGEMSGYGGPNITTRAGTRKV